MSEMSEMSGIDRLSDKSDIPDTFPRAAELDRRAAVCGELNPTLAAEYPKRAARIRELVGRTRGCGLDSAPSMDAKARRALSIIQECVSRDRYVLLPHFVQRMDERGFFWPDVLAVIDEPNTVRDAGRDRYGRPKWIVCGTTPDGVTVELVCALDRDKRGHWTVFITIY